MKRLNKFLLNKLITTVAFGLIVSAGAVARAETPLPTCFVTNGSIIPTIRFEGMTELIGDIVIVCSGGVPVATGNALPQISISVSLNTTSITSRLESNGTEALVIVDDPGAALPTSPANQLACPSVDGCAIVSNGDEPYDGSAGHPNIFQGIPSANGIMFPAIPFSAPGDSRMRTFRITNIRIGGSSFFSTAVPVQALASVAISGDLLLTNNSSLTVACLRTGLIYTTRNAANTAAINAADLSTCSAGSPCGVAQLQFQENFSPAFARRLQGTAQNIPGTIYNSESGFYSPGLVASNPDFSTIGLADSGTRLKANFHGIPQGAQLWVGTVGSGQGVLTADEKGPFNPVSATGTISGMPAAQLAVAGGKASAVWEVTQANPPAIDTLTFPVWVVFPAGSTPSGSLTVNGSFAPNPDDGAFPYSGANTEQNSSFPIPRFVSLTPLVQPANLTLQYTKAVAGASPTGPVTGVVSVSGSAPVPFNAVASSAGPFTWLSASPASGSAGDSVTVTADGSALQPGTYTGAVTFTFSNGNITTVPVQLVVTTVGIAASAGSVQTSLVNNSYGTPLSVILTDQNRNPVAGQTVTFTAPSTGAGVTFLGASQTNANLASTAKASRPVPSHISSGVSATAITNAQGIASVSVKANSISGTFTVTATIAGLTVPFNLTNLASAPVSPAPPPVPLNPQIDPAYLVLQYVKAAASAAPTAPTVATLNVNGAFSSSYRATFTAPWLALTPIAGFTGGATSLSANGSALQPGIYSTTVTFTFGDGSTVSVPVQLTVVPPPSFKASVTALAFVAQAGSTTVQTQSFNIQSAGPNFTAALTVADVQGSGGGSWLTVSPSSIATAAAVQATVNPTGLAAGIYQKNIVATANGVGNSPFAIPVTLTVTAPPPAISVTSVVNAASFATGPVAPNTIAAAFGTFPGCSSDAQVTVDGMTATVFYSSPAQISFLIRAAVAGESTAQSQISCAGLSATVAIPIATAAPSLFSVSQNGTGEAALVNQDGTVSTPSLAGTVVQLFGTGFGAYGPAGSDGLTWISKPVTATVGGAAAQVMFAGQAPGYTPGLQQIDILIPAGSPKGQAIPIQLSTGGATTQAGITLIVQ